MKKFITAISLLAGLTIGAQNKQFEIELTMDQNLSGASWTNSMSIEFSPNGSNFNDTLDQTGLISDSALAYPFTINASYNALRLLDARPTLRHTRSVSFGAWTKNSGEMHLRGNWSNAADANLYDVLIRENATGFFYDMYAENTFNISADTFNTIRFTIFFVPKIVCNATDATCYTSTDGSLQIESPSQDWSMNVYQNSVLTNSFSVLANDTLLTGLGQGSYEIEYMIDGVAYDTASVTISSYAPVVAAASMSDSTPTIAQSVDFTNTSTGASTYLWDFGDGFTSTDASPGHCYSVQGTYAATLTATSAQGCTSTVTFVVVVSPFSLAGPPSHTPTRGNSDPNEMARVTSQVQSQNNQAAITVNGDATITQFSVYSMNGQLLLMGSANDNTFTYDAPGIYILHVLYSDGTAETKQYYLN